MKVCENCGTEIDTKDGDNLCAGCERNRLPAKKAKRRRNVTRDVYASLGMTRVRGALGGTYYE